MNGDKNEIDKLIDIPYLSQWWCFINQMLKI